MNRPFVLETGDDCFPMMAPFLPSAGDVIEVPIDLTTGEDGAVFEVERVRWVMVRDEGDVRRLIPHVSTRQVDTIESPAAKKVRPLRKGKASAPKSKKKKK